MARICSRLRYCGHEREPPPKHMGGATVIAVSAAVAVAYAIGLFALIVVPGAVTLLKGQYVLFLAGSLAGGLVWMITAFRLARPGSWWGRRSTTPIRLGARLSDIPPWRDRVPDAAPPRNRATSPERHGPPARVVFTAPSTALGVGP